MKSRAFCVCSAPTGGDDYHMAYKITDECLACGTCVDECPNEAISEEDPIYVIDADNSLYTGISNDVEERVKAHNAGKGAKYTRMRGPVLAQMAEDRPA